MNKSAIKNQPRGRGKASESGNAKASSSGGRGSGRASSSRTASAQQELRPPEDESADCLSVVRQKLQTYADRGVFRGFNESKSSGGLPVFSFVWMLAHPMELSLDANKRLLRFKQLLPNVPADSVMYAELKQFVAQRHDPALPMHRRIDPARGVAACYNRAGFVSLALRVNDNDYAYAANRIVNLVHELFVHLRDAYPDYLMENFDVPRE